MTELSVWQVFSLIDFFFRIEPAFVTIAGFILLSAWPVVLFWPYDRNDTTQNMRRIDPESLFEALEEMPESPARRLVLERIKDRFGSSGTLRTSALKTVIALTSREKKTLRIQIIAAMGLVAVIQLTGIVATGELVWGGNGSFGPSAAGNRRNAAREHTAAGIVQKDQDTEDNVSSENFGAENLKSSNQGTINADESGWFGHIVGKPGLPGELPPGLPERAIPQAWGTAMHGPKPNDDDTTASGTGNNSRMPGGKEPPSSVIEEKHTPGSGEANRGRGFEKTGATGIPSPIVDYRSWMERVATVHLGHTSAAIGELSAGKFDEAARHIFASFRIPSGIQKEEDPYTVLLRNRWIVAQKALK